MAGLTSIISFHPSRQKKELMFEREKLMCNLNVTTLYFPQKLFFFKKSWSMEQYLTLRTFITHVCQKTDDFPFTAQHNVNHHEW